MKIWTWYFNINKINFDNRTFLHCYLPCQLLFNGGTNSYLSTYMGQCYFGGKGGDGAGILIIFLAKSPFKWNIFIIA